VADVARARLTALARAHGDDVQRLLTRYSIERLLYRIGVSPYRDRFVLKGAMLFSLWADAPYRMTGDLDLLAAGDPAPDAVAAVFRQIAMQPVDDDGVVFLPDTLRVEATRADDAYAGAAIRMTAMFAGARLTILVDLGFGDVVTPVAREVDYPSLLDAPRPRLRAYPPETVVAEKFQALVELGLFNSRLKDFFDLWAIAGTFAFDGEILGAAIEATFVQRATALPTDTPPALTAEFSNDTEKRRLWRACLGRAGVTTAPDDLADVVLALDAFLTPLSASLAVGGPFDQTWHPGGPWRAKATTSSAERP